MAVPWPQLLGLALLVVLVGQVTGAALAVGVACWLLCFVVASRLFGVEFDDRTLPRLLAQPLSRSRIWWEKMLVGAVLILAGGGAVLLMLWLVLSKLQLQGLRGTLQGWFVLMPLIALATGPTVSLWLRDSLRTLWVSMALPIAVQMIVLMLWISAGGGVRGPHFALILVPYCAVMLCLGYRRFLALEIASGGAAPDGRLIAINRKGIGQKAEVADLKRRPLGVTRELVLKEGRLQYPGLVLMTLATAAWVGLWLLSFKADMPLASGGVLGDWLEFLRVVPLVVLLAVVPALIGASAVAAERQLGVTGWQLAQPISCRRQWWVKLAVCGLLALLSALLGAVLGWVLPGASLTFMNLPKLTYWFGWWPLLALTAGLFGSRHSRGPFQALGLSLIFGAGLWYLWHLLEFTATVAVRLWPDTIAPVLNLGNLRVGGLVDVAMIVLLWVLVWAVPRQEEWVTGSRPERSRSLAVFAALVFIAVAAQAWLFTWASYELEREIAVKDAEIEAPGGTASLKWLIRELGLPADRPEIDNLVTIIDLGFYMTVFDGQTTGQDWVLQPASRVMDLSFWVDGAPLTRLDRWYWQRSRRGLMFGGVAADDPIEVRVLPRDGPRRWRAFSIAPLWFQGKRQAQLDRRVRQNVILEAVATGRQLARQRSWDPKGFRQSIERGLLFLRHGMSRRIETQRPRSGG